MNELSMWAIWLLMAIIHSKQSQASSYCITWFNNRGLVNTVSASLYRIISLTLAGSTTSRLFILVHVSVSQVIIAQLDPLIWLNAIFWWVNQHKAIMLVADSFPHLNNSISEAAPPAQGAQRKDDWQICRAAIHEMRWDRAEESESELEVENLSGFVLSSLITPSHCFPWNLVLFFSTLLKVVMTILNTVSMEKGSRSYATISGICVMLWKREHFDF